MTSALIDRFNLSTECNSACGLYETRQAAYDKLLYCNSILPINISDVDIVPGRSPRSNRGNCDNSTSNQMITNTTEGYENDNDITNPVVGYEKHLDQKDKVGVE